ncbi:MAG: polyprenyl synthetase family protein [Candidatus Omnitrophota bacterium]|nr:polyprenyl synthetase family protein [Candidatus Omnitrophota bacterium]
MVLEIKNRIEKELSRFLRDAERLYRLKRLSPLLAKHLKEFVLRPGKRLRPTLFVLAYKGLARHRQTGLYRSAIAIELLHTFMLIHDDIIDKAERRRDKPSLHAQLGNHLAQYAHIKFNGQDLSLVIGDILYAMAIAAFISINEDPTRKEKALRKLVEAAVFTGSGEFIELLYGAEAIDNITSKTVTNIYDYKTAHYTFVCPLTTAGILAGTTGRTLDTLERCGILWGRAFQIRDDILGLFGDETKIGKSTMSDLQEAKKTILIWHAWRHSSAKTKTIIRKILEAKIVTQAEHLIIQRIIRDAGTLEYAEQTISSFVEKACRTIKTIPLREPYRKQLISYSEEIILRKA